VLTAGYRLGELLSVEPDSEHTARRAEAPTSASSSRPWPTNATRRHKEGLYRFKLPGPELPANVQQAKGPPTAEGALERYDAAQLMPLLRALAGVADRHASPVCGRSADGNIRRMRRTIVTTCGGA
jgi:hypothetical protein